MKQSSLTSPSSLDFPDKDPNKKKPLNKEPQTDINSDDIEKASATHSKGGSHFDFSNFGLFFKNKSSNSRSSKDSSASRLHIQKKSNETSSSKESTMKRMSSKDFSDLGELYENTTVITNPVETKPASNKISNDVSLSKILADDDLDVLLGEELDKDGIRITKGVRKDSKDERLEHDPFGTISKLGFADDADALVKLSKTDLNAEVIERIKTKALPHRRTSTSNSTSNSNQSSTPSGNIEIRTNNNSVFTGLRQMSTKGKDIFDNSFSDPIKATVSALFNSPEVSSPSRNQQPTSLLTKSIEAQELTREDLEKTAKKKHNLSTIATDSTLDSDHITTLNFNYHNNSFSTPFSGTSGSYNNSGKTDFNSPLRLDSGRLTENLNGPMNPNYVNLQQAMNSVPVQRNPFNLNQNLMGFYGGHGSGNNTDRSNNSFSWNEEYAVSNFSSALSTPQGMQQQQQQQQFFNQNLTVPSSLNTKEQQYSTQNLRTQTVRSQVSNSYAGPEQISNPNFSSPSTSNKGDNNPSSAQKEGKSAGPKNKKKNQEPKDHTQFEVDLHRVEINPRTTLMVKNIPNKYDLPLMLQTIEKNHKGKFDFFYLPIDPRNKCNVGYAFINFADPRAIKEFYTEFNGKRWEKFNSEKICDIKYARIQGKKALMHHFQYSNVMNQQDKKLRPYIPQEFEMMNNQKIKDLVTKQRVKDESYGSKIKRID
jgi:hypothetical protein